MWTTFTEMLRLVSNLLVLVIWSGLNLLFQVNSYEVIVSQIFPASLMGGGRVEEGCSGSTKLRKRISNTSMFFGVIHGQGQHQVCYPSTKLKHNRKCLCNCFFLNVVGNCCCQLLHLKRLQMVSSECCSPVSGSWKIPHSASSLLAPSERDWKFSQFYISKGPP